MFAPSNLLHFTHLSREWVVGDHHPLRVLLYFSSSLSSFIDRHRMPDDCQGFWISLKKTAAGLFDTLDVLSWITLVAGLVVE